jgi:hypothetical protein
MPAPSLMVESCHDCSCSPLHTNSSSLRGWKDGFPSQPNNEQRKRLRDQAALQAGTSLRLLVNKVIAHDFCFVSTLADDSSPTHAWP